MKRSNPLIVATGVVAILATVLLPASAAPGRIELQSECARYASEGIDVRECDRQATIARDASAKYRDFKAALADGFAPISECEYSSSGAMGQHWARIDRMAIDGVNPRTPACVPGCPRFHASLGGGAQGVGDGPCP